MEIFGIFTERRWLIVDLIAVYVIITLAIMGSCLLDYSIKPNKKDARDFVLAPLWPLRLMWEWAKGVVGFFRLIPKILRDAWK
jgi:hypothetical protein